MDLVGEFRDRHPNAEPLHSGGMVIIGTPTYKRVAVRGTRSRNLAQRGIYPEVRFRWRQVSVVKHSKAFDFDRLGWKEACRLAWEDASKGYQS